MSSSLCDVPRHSWLPLPSDGRPKPRTRFRAWMRPCSRPRPIDPLRTTSGSATRLDSWTQCIGTASATVSPERTESNTVACAVREWEQRTDRIRRASSATRAARTPPPRCCSPSVLKKGCRAAHAHSATPRKPSSSLAARSLAPPERPTGTPCAPSTAASSIRPRLDGVETTAVGTSWSGSCAQSATSGPARARRDR